MLGLLRRTRPDPGPRRRLETSVHEALRLGPEERVRISEVTCGAEGCTDVVIALLVMRNGKKTEIYRVERDLASVTVDDLLEAVRPPPPDPRSVPLAEALAKLRR